MNLKEDSKSELITFRKLTIKDNNKLFEIYSDKAAMKFRGSKAMENIEEAKWFVKHQMLKEQNTLTIRKGVELKGKKELIGSVMYRFREEQKLECEIGYSIGQQYWGKGLGNEVVRLLVEELRNDKECVKIIAWCNKENVASIKVLEKNGFELVEQTKIPESFLYSRLVTK